jgi:hypothetical protein
VEPATTDRIQRMIDAEATERFPPDAVPRLVLDQLQSRLGEQVGEHFPDGGVQRIALLQHGDDPSVEPGGLLARVFIEEAGEAPSHRLTERARELDELKARF